MCDYSRDHKTIIAPEDEALFDQQQETGAIMDACVKREMFLQKHKQAIVGDDSLMLYRLPLNPEQMKKVYDGIIKNNKESGL